MRAPRQHCAAMSAMSFDIEKGADARYDFQSRNQIWLIVQNSSTRLAVAVAVPPELCWTPFGHSLVSGIVGSATCL